MAADFFTYRVTNFGIFHFLCHICGLRMTQKVKNPFEINASLFTFRVTRQCCRQTICR